MIEPTFTNMYNGTYHVTNVCVMPGCGHVTKADVDGSQVFQWRQGTFAAQAYPGLSLTQIEALFVSGICGFCWDTLFPDEEEDYDEPDMILMAEAFGEGPGYGDSDPMGYNSDSYINYLNGN
jgi:hypothetical protein